LKDVQKQLAELTPAQQELFQLLRKERQQRSAALTQAIPRRPDQAAAPLSFSQQRLWFLDQWDPGSPAYNLPQAVQLRGQLDRETLRRTLNAIVSRHEALRTTFIAREGAPHAVVAPSLELALPVVDLRALPADQRERAAQERLRTEATRPFDLQRGPLLRVELLRLQDDVSILLIVIHHIVSDGWSNGVLVREIGAHYQAFAAGKPAPLAELPIQYADYAHWQRGWLQGQRLDQHLSYWKQQLAGATTVLALPTDRPRPTTQTSAGARHYLSIPLALRERLKALSQREGASLFMTLLAAFQALCYRYTGQEDMLVGSPVANRNRAETEPLIGFFVNTLVLRARLTGSLSFRQLLQQARQVTLGAQDHQDLPFEKLIEELNLERDMARNPLFQVMFTLQNAPLPSLSSSQLTITPLELDNGSALFDLSLDLYETADGMRGWFEYNTHLFDAATIERTASHFTTLLDDLSANPDQPIGAANLLTAAEREQLLVGWNPAWLEQPGQRCVHQLFEEQAALQPSATAVTCGDEQLSYQLLNARANAIGRTLRERGVRPGDFVGVCMDRSPTLIAAILGVLKAGAAYVPLDPTHPRDRLAYILADTSASILLSAPAHRAQLPEQRPPTIMLDDALLASADADANLDSRVSAQHPAYVIYTSGSTSQSKGVVVAHGSLASVYAVWRQTYGLERAARSHLQMANLTFDVFCGDLVRALCSGGKLVICPRDLLLDAPRLYQLIEQQAIACAEFVPVVLRNLLSYMEQRQLTFEHMRVLVCGSDAWYVEEYRRVQRRCRPDARVINSFGLTEATIDSTFFEGGAAHLADDRVVPIGRPFANTQIYILDSRLAPAPTGAPGELCIGGAGLAQSYLNRPRLTAERYCPHPFSAEPGARLYRTGDRARYLPDGQIEFLGRMDDQVKVRGYRVEPGEIESVLRQYPGIREAAVVAQTEGVDDTRLIAYVTSIETPPPTAERLRTFTRERLPDYMTPNSFVVLEAMPLNSSGKINRRVLPALTQTRLETGTAYVAPRTTIEELLADIWSRVLGVERVGVFDNFFTLGGHSLLATQVMARIGQVCAVDLPLRTLFDHATVSALALQVEQAQDQSQGRQSPPITSVARDQALPLSFPQEQLWVIDQITAGNVAYVIPAMVRICGQLDIDALQYCFDAIVARHEIFRTTYLQQDDRPVQVIHPPSQIPLVVIDLRAHATPEAEALRQAGELSMQPIDLTTGPMARCVLFRLTTDEYALLFLMHHIVIDEWSSDMLLQEMQELYLARIQGRAAVLPELAVHYADFAAWQRQWFQGERLERELAYWRRQLAGAPSMIDLPTDRPRPAEQTFHGHYQLVELSPHLAAELRALSHASGATMFMTLLAAFNVLLYRTSGQTDLVLGTPIANRNKLEVERVIGYFLNTLLIRSDLSGNPTFREALERTRATCLEAYAHQEIHFEKLVQALQPRRDLNRNPLFNMMFVFNPNYPMADVEAGGLTLSYMYLPREVARFDLIMYFFESARGTSVQLNYNTDLFDHQTMTRMIEHYILLLEQCVQNPARPIDSLPMMQPWERQLLLDMWSATPAESSNPCPIHELFTAQAARTPDAIALAQGQRTLTYGELDQRSTQLARYLRSMGVGPETPVGLWLERSPELIISVLAILKAGGAYVPLDPSYPLARLRFVLDDTRMPLLLTQRGLADAALEQLDPAERPALQIVDLDQRWGQIAAQPLTPLPETASLDRLAYIMYTSGSTGAPKGVSVTHRNVVRLVWDSTFMEFSPNDRWLQLAPIAFDASTLEIWGSLLHGARLTLAPARQPSLAELSQLLAEQQITVLWLTAGLFHQMADQHLDGLRSVRQLLAGGDVLPMPQVRAVLRELPQCTLINGYGPTENTTFTACYTVPHTEPEGLSVPIGYPITHTQVYILDRHMQPAPIGVAGELYAGGAGVARGYLHRPALTAEAFTPDPFSDQPGARLYRTGDLARFLADGRIEFLGRIDQQVKLRGFRIELGEIEAALLLHPAVRAAAVVARPDHAGDKTLVAYIVGQEQAAELPSAAEVAAELRPFLRQRLPDYMTPGVFVPLAALPLTANGKVDRHALPAPDREARPVTAAVTPPSTPAQQQLAALWSELLGIAQVGIHDNFFELGGHSLLATQLIAQVRAAFEVDIALLDFFTAPTIAQLAQHIQVAQWATQSRRVAQQAAASDEVEGEL
jgi:amino acid adenylation domain-containing protein